MYELVNYVNDKYKELPDDFNFEAITSKNLQVDEFFRVYAEKISLKDRSVSWHPAMLRHVVHLDVVHIFATLALETVEFDPADNNKLVKCLARCSSDSKVNHKIHPFSRLMIAIKSKYTKIEDAILR